MNSIFLFFIFSISVVCQAVSAFPFLRPNAWCRVRWQSRSGRGRVVAIGCPASVGRIGKAVKFRHVPNAVRGTAAHWPLVSTGKARRRDEPESEDRPDRQGCRSWTGPVSSIDP